MIQFEALMTTSAILSILAPVLPVVSTLLGGYAVYRWKRDLHPWLSFSGGVLLGVAFLDLLPEAIDQAAQFGIEPQTLFLGTLFAILLFHILDRTLSFHAHHEHVDGKPAEPCENDRHRQSKSVIRASSMILHSVLDGVAIGGGFAVNLNLGILVLLAVIMHDFSDGMSTVTMLKQGLGHGHRWILPFLVMDAVAPFIGAFLGRFLAPNGSIIAFMLAGFAGFFLFLALSDLLPQAHSGRMSRQFGFFLTVLGVGLVLLIRTLAPV